MNLVAKEDANGWNCLLSLNAELTKHGISYPVNFVCGIFTAVVSCKDLVPTQSWVKLFMAESNIDNIDSANELFQSLLAVYNKTAMQLYDDRFAPVLLESMKLVNWHEGTTESIMDWCFGYCRGMELSPSIWLKEQYEYSMPIALLGGVIDIDKEEPPTNEELADFAMMVPSLAQSVYNIAFDAREDEIEFQSEKSKLGRNEPCLCGSGKKYKKCCLEGKKIERIH